MVHQALERLMSFVIYRNPCSAAACCIPGWLSSPVFQWHVLSDDLIACGICSGSHPLSRSDSTFVNDALSSPEPSVIAELLSGSAQQLASIQAVQSHNVCVYLRIDTR